MPVQVEERDLRAITEALNAGWVKSRADLELVLQSAGYRTELEDVEAIAEELNISAKAPLTLEDVCKAAQKLKPENQLKTIYEKALKPFDSFGDGALQVEQLKEIIKNMAELTKDELDTLLKQLDPNEVGRVYLETFYTLLSAKNLEV